MYAKILVLLNLMAFAVVASQPLFYLLALSNTQKNLRASAYIETRKLLDKNLKMVLGYLYYSALALVLALIVVAATHGKFLLLITALISFAALAIDLLLAIRTNIPINNIINQWDADDYPRHWQLIRRKWFYFYHFRQVADVVGFTSLLVGAVFG